MAKSLCCKPLAILIIEESYLQRFFHTLMHAPISASPPAISKIALSISIISISVPSIRKKGGLKNMYPHGYQLQSQRGQTAYRYGGISFYHCIIDHIMPGLPVRSACNGTIQGYFY